MIHSGGLHGDCILPWQGILWSRGFLVLDRPAADNDNHEWRYV